MDRLLNILWPASATRQHASIAARQAGLIAIQLEVRSVSARHPRGRHAHYGQPCLRLVIMQLTPVCF